MIIHTNQKSKRKVKDSAKKKALRSSWQELLEKWDVKPKQTKDFKARIGPVVTVPVERSTSHIPSVDTGVGDTTKKESPKYTGDAMIGIGTLHKSNAVPVFKQEDAEDLAKMRR